MSCCDTIFNSSRPWGRPYKLLLKETQKKTLGPGLKRKDGSITKTKEETESYLFETKFPKSDNPPMERSLLNENNKIDLADEFELRELLRKRNNKSSPGKDQIRWKHSKILNVKQP